MGERSRKYADPRYLYPDPYGYGNKYPLERLSPYPPGTTQQSELLDRQRSAERMRAIQIAYAKRYETEYNRTVVRLRQIARGGLYGLTTPQLSSTLNRNPRIKQYRTLAEMFSMR